MKREYHKNRYHNMNDEEKQKLKDYQSKYKQTWLMNKNKNIEKLKDINIIT